MILFLASWACSNDLEKEFIVHETQDFHYNINQQFVTMNFYNEDSIGLVNIIPKDIILYITDYLPAYEMNKLTEVCKGFQCILTPFLPTTVSLTYFLNNPEKFYQNNILYITSDEYKDMPYLLRYNVNYYAFNFLKHFFDKLESLEGVRKKKIILRNLMGSHNCHILNNYKNLKISFIEDLPLIPTYNNMIINNVENNVNQNGDIYFNVNNYNYQYAHLIPLKAYSFELPNCYEECLNAFTISLFSSLDNASIRERDIQKVKGNIFETFFYFKDSGLQKRNFMSYLFHAILKFEKKSKIPFLDYLDMNSLLFLVEHSNYELAYFTLESFKNNIIDTKEENILGIYQRKFEESLVTNLMCEFCCQSVEIQEKALQFFSNYNMGKTKTSDKYRLKRFLLTQFSQWDEEKWEYNTHFLIKFGGRLTSELDFSYTPSQRVFTPEVECLLNLLNTPEEEHEFLNKIFHRFDLSTKEKARKIIPYFSNIKSPQRVNEIINQHSPFFEAAEHNQRKVRLSLLPLFEKIPMNDITKENLENIVNYSPQILKYKKDILIDLEDFETIHEGFRLFILSYWLKMPLPSSKQKLLSHKYKLSLLQDEAINSMNISFFNAITSETSNGNNNFTYDLSYECFVSSGNNEPNSSQATNSSPTQEQKLKKRKREEVEATKVMALTEPLLERTPAINNKKSIKRPKHT